MTEREACAVSLPAVPGSGEGGVEESPGEW